MRPFFIPVRRLSDGARSEVEVFGFSRADAVAFLTEHLSSTYVIEVLH